MNEENAPGPSTLYGVTPERADAIEREFVYHAPKGDQAIRYQAIRDRARVLAIEIAQFAPPSREQSLAFTALGEAVMWANAAIARNE